LIARDRTLKSRLTKVSLRLRVFESLRPFSRSGAVGDVMAGVTLASVNIPQVLGYTRIAGTPVVTGLYTVLLPLVAFAAFGSSRHLVVAADSATAAIFSSSLSQTAVPASEKYMALAGMVALLTAGFLLLARIFKGFSRASGFRSAWRCSATFSVSRWSRTARSFRHGRSCRACRGSIFRRCSCPRSSLQASCLAIVLLRACLFR
jgi:hypothetical protein